MTQNASRTWVAEGVGIELPRQLSLGGQVVGIKDGVGGDPDIGEASRPAHEPQEHVRDAVLRLWTERSSSD